MKKIILAIVTIVAVVFGIKYYKSSSNERGFERLLAYVPKDTSYLFGNKKPTPAEFRERQAKSIETLINSLEKRESKNEKSDKAIKFIKKVVKSYRDNNFESFGLTKDRSAIIYGLNNYPVLRTEITSSNKFIESLNSIAKDTNSTVEWKLCGIYQCIQDDSSKELGLTLVVKNSTIAMALYPADKKDEYIQHLIDEPNIKNSYSIDNFNKLLSNNNFKGYGDGFIKLKPIVNLLLSSIGTKELSAKKRDELTKCILPMANDFTDAVDTVIIGYKALDKDNLESDMIIHTNKKVADALKSIVSENRLTKVAKEPALAIGLRVDAKNLSTAIMSLTNYTVSEAKKYNCSTIDTRKLLKSASSASLMLSIFGSQLSEAYFGLDSVKLSKTNGQPELFKALIEVVSANPDALIGMLKAKVPEFALVNLPKDGTESDLLKVLPKPSPKFITSLTASLKENTIAINVSDTEIKEFKDNKHTLLWMDMNNNKLLTLFEDSIRYKTARERVTLDKFKNMGFLKEDEYKRRVSRLEEQEKSGKLGIDAIMSAYPKDFETNLKLYMDDRGIIFNTKQNRIK